MQATWAKVDFARGVSCVDNFGQWGDFYPQTRPLPGSGVGARRV